MRLSKLILPIFLITISLLVVIPQTPLGHAVNLINQVTRSACGGTSCAFGSLQVTSGNELVVILDSQFIVGPYSVTDSLGNSYSNPISLTSSGNILEKWFIATVQTTGSDVITMNYGSGDAVDGDALQYFAFNGIGSQVSTTVVPGSGSGTDSQTMTITGGSIVLETGSILNSISNTCGTQSMTDVNLFDICETSAGTVGHGSHHNTHNTPSAGSVTFTNTYAGWNAPGGFIHLLVEIKAVSSINSLGLITQCYGACGSTAITLTNSNATHTINFNQSYTLFYEFQSNLNGVLLNVTTNIAKTYANGQQVALGAYTATCPAGVTPFTLRCAGQLQPGSVITTPNPSKGRFAILPQVQVVSGMWIAIAVSGVFSGLDLNQTDKGCGVAGDQGICVPPMQFTNGIIPTVLSSSASCNGTPSPCNVANISTTGLWAWIQGNVQTGLPPPQPSIGCINTDLACFLVASACGLSPSNCFIGGAVIFFIYFVVFVVSITLSISYINREYEMQVQFPPSLFFVFFLIELFTFGALNLIPPVIVITVFLFIALGVAGYFGSAFLGRSKRE